MPQPSDTHQPNAAVDLHQEWGALPLGELHQLDAVCDRFEQALKNEHDSHIEAFVADLTDSQRRLVVCALVPLEIEWRVSRGQTPAPDDYIRRFPQWAEELQEVVTVQLESLNRDQPASNGTQMCAADDTAIVLTRDQFAERLAASDILPAGASQKILKGHSDDESAIDGRQLAALLIEQEVLTPYQAQQLYADGGKSLVLGNYVILDRIGQGGMGHVFKARHTRMKRVVALKVLSPEVTGNFEALSRFEREVEAAAHLTHPNIVTAYDADETQNTHFLVMEYVDGTDLSKLLSKRGSLPIGTVVDYVLQAARGLEYAHGRGVVHRDIKPANLLLDETGVVKVLDMGLARLNSFGVDVDEKVGVEPPQSTGEDQDQLTSIGQIMGTVDYIAPEQALNTREADARADIYSLGITLWHLATGTVPDAGNSPAEKLLAHESASIPPLVTALPDVSEMLNAAFSRMVATLPEERFHTMSEVIAALEVCRAAEPRETGSGETNSGSGRLAAGNAALSSTGEDSRDTEPALEMHQSPESAAMAETISLASSKPDSDPQFLSSQLPVSEPVSELSTAVPTQPPVNSWWRRRNLLAVTVGVVALFFCGYIIIKIVRKDGSELEVVAPDDVRKVEIIESSDSPDAVAVNSGPGSTGFSVSNALSGYEWPKDAPPPAIAPFNSDQATQHQQAWADYLKVPVEHTNTVGMKFRLIPPGEFLMGVELSEIDFMKLRIVGEKERREMEAAVSRASPRHKVRITRPYYLQSHEVTYGLLQKILGKVPAGAESEELDSVAHSNVSLFDAIAFCNELSKLEGKSVALNVDGPALSRVPRADGYRLPTEVEWECACRAGTATLWFFGDDPHGDGPVYGAILKEHQTRWFGSKAKANPFGLVDMYAGSTEWCFDRYRLYQSEAVVDPYTDPGRATVVVRGGSVFAGAGNSVIANNGFDRFEAPASLKMFSGFGRVVLPVRLPESLPVDAVVEP